MSKKRRLYRQGDVLLVECPNITREELLERGGQVLPRDKGRVVLAYGEVTGHAHAVLEPHVQLIACEGLGDFVVSEDGGFSLSHEEHGEIGVLAGIYEKIQQREYSEVESRLVLD